MLCTCPKCGQERELSPGELRALKGSVVCPRCLAVYQVDSPKVDSGDAADTPPPVPPRRKPQSSRKPAMPAAARPETVNAYCNYCGALIPAGRSNCAHCGAPVTCAPARDHYSTTTMSSRQQQRNPISFVDSNQPAIQSSRAQQPSRKPSRKRKKRKTAGKGLTYWGCAAYTALFTAILLVLYYIVGNLLS